MYTHAKATKRGLGFDAIGWVRFWNNWQKNTIGDILAPFLEPTPLTIKLSIQKDVKNNLIWSNIRNLKGQQGWGEGTVEGSKSSSKG